MSVVEDVLKELEMLIGKTDDKSKARIDELTLWLKENRSPEVKEAFNAFMNRGLERIKAEIDDVRKKIEA